jgi:hypothetical protein
MQFLESKKNKNSRKIISKETDEKLTFPLEIIIFKTNNIKKKYYKSLKKKSFYFILFIVAYYKFFE